MLFGHDRDSVFNAYGLLVLQGLHAGSDVPEAAGRLVVGMICLREIRELRNANSNTQELGHGQSIGGLHLPQGKIRANT